MRNYIQILTVLLCTVFANTSLLAQTKNWITEKTEDGSVSVKSCISECKDEKSDIVPLIEYTATATIRVDYQNCISVMQNVSKHKAFLIDAKESKTINTLSKNQLLVYYSFNAPWPFSDYDCVCKMWFVENQNTAIFTLVAEPLMYQKTDDDRLTSYKMSYQFKDLKNGTVKIIITGKMSPLIAIPLWMLRNTMPDRPAQTLHKIVALANEIQKQ